MTSGNARLPRRKRRLGTTWSQRWNRILSIYDSAIPRLKDLKWLIGTIAAVVTLILSWVGHTRTGFTVAGVGPDSTMKVNVLAKGPILKQSILQDYRLTFGNLPIEDATLTAVSEKGDASTVTIRPLNFNSPPVLLTAGGLRGRCRDAPVINSYDRYRKEDIEPLIEAERVTLIMHVQESDDKVDTPHEYQETFPAKLIQNFITNHLPDRIPKRTCS